MRRIAGRASEERISPRKRKSSTTLDEPVRPDTQDPVQLKRHMLDMINRFVLVCYGSSLMAQSTLLRSCLASQFTLRHFFLGRLSPLSG